MNLSVMSDGHEPVSHGPVSHGLVNHGPASHGSLLVWFASELSCAGRSVGHDFSREMWKFH